MLINSSPENMEPKPYGPGTKILVTCIYFIGYKGFSHPSPHLVLKATLRGRPDARTSGLPKANQFSSYLC